MQITYTKEQIPTPASSLQEIYDFISSHLRKQGERSTLKFKDNEICAYRSKTNLTCAAGCLLTEEDYNTELEGRDFVKSNFILYEPQEIVNLEKTFINHVLFSKWKKAEKIKLLLIRALQLIHDNNLNWQTNEKKKFIGEVSLKDLTTKFNLLYTAP